MATLDRRLILDEKLRRILGSSNLYFEPPTSQMMKYPCIRYKRSNIDVVFADNKPYLGRNRYEIVAIFEDADDDLPERLLYNKEGLVLNLERPYVADGLHHYVFTTHF